VGEYYDPNETGYEEMCEFYEKNPVYYNSYTKATYELEVKK